MKQLDGLTIQQLEQVRGTRSRIRIETLMEQIDRKIRTKNS